MYDELDEFLKLIFERNPRQKSSIMKTMNLYFTEDDLIQLKEVLRFYRKTISLDEIVDAYNLIVEDTTRETKYFLLHGKYRYSSFEETEKLVYSNYEYMSKYMVGLAISGYLWPNHIKVFHWYRSILHNHTGSHFLEVGPGHGRYFCEAVKQNGFSAYDAIDVSETSVAQTREYLCENLTKNQLEKCNVFLQNAYDYKPEIKYDFIVIAEVLEHLEKPDKMLELMNKISNDNAFIYITVPVNAPAIDHIFLFETIDSVETMVTKAGYKIIDRLYAAGGDMEIEKAIKRKNAILVGLLAKKDLL